MGVVKKTHTAVHCLFIFLSVHYVFHFWSSFALYFFHSCMASLLHRQLIGFSPFPLLTKEAQWVPEEEANVYDMPLSIFPILVIVNNCDILDFQKCQYYYLYIGPF